MEQEKELNIYCYGCQCMNCGQMVCPFSECEGKYGTDVVMRCFKNDCISVYPQYPKD